jgi:hypothetical protein
MVSWAALNHNRGYNAMVDGGIALVVPRPSASAESCAGGRVLVGARSARRGPLTARRPSAPTQHRLPRDAAGAAHDLVRFS